VFDDSMPVYFDYCMAGILSHRSRFGGNNMHDAHDTLPGSGRSGTVVSELEWWKRQWRGPRQEHVGIAIRIRAQRNQRVNLCQH